jgi:hypothetical protein
MSINTDPARTSPYISPAMTPLGGQPSPKPGGVPPPPIQAPMHMRTQVMMNMNEGNLWSVIMFFMILGGMVKLLTWHWWQGLLMLILATAFLMAVYYAKRPRIHHRLARSLVATFFVTFRDVHNQLPARRFLRIPIAFAVSILCAFVFVLL